MKEAILALLKQGKKSVDRNGMCKYRGPDGLKCAVGHMLSDEEYKPEMENVGVKSLVTLYKLDFSYDITLLRALQSAHDCTQDETFVDDFKANLRRTPELSKLLDEVLHENY